MRDSRDRVDGLPGRKDPPATSASVPDQAISALARVLGCFGIPILGATAVVILLESGKPTEPFTPERWAALAPHDRERVVDDLLERRLLIGLADEKVRALLGEPFEGTWRDEDLSYRIGTEFGRGEFLMITFAGEKVDSAWTWYPSH